MNTEEAAAVLRRVELRLAQWEQATLELGWTVVALPMWREDVAALRTLTDALARHHDIGSQLTAADWGKACPICDPGDNDPALD